MRFFFVSQTLRAFLDGMVERKRGHVVAVCSMAGKMTIPCAVAYCATKFGVSGFMEALNDELALLDQDFIKLTTVYPTFINTQKELGKRLDDAGIPRIEPSLAAHLIVKAMLRNRRNLYIPNFAKRTLIVKYGFDWLFWLKSMTFFPV
jgi:all-trans-retinol dehydrogenase (NAD+)